MERFIEVKINTYIESILKKPYLEVSDYYVLVYELERQKRLKDKERIDEIIESIVEKEVV